MKRAKIILLTLLAAFVMAFGFAGCSDPAVGKYGLYSLTIERSSVLIEFKTGEYFPNMEERLSADMVTAELKADGSFIMESSILKVKAISATWERDSEGKLILTYDGGSQEFSFENNILTLELNEVTLKLSR